MNEEDRHEHKLYTGFEVMPTGIIPIAGGLGVRKGIVRVPIKMAFDAVSFGWQVLPGTRVSTPQGDMVQVKRD